MVKGSGSNNDEFLGELGEMIEYYFENGPKDGAALARAVVQQVGHRFGGVELYIKKGQGRHPAANKIRQEFDGTNLAEIMERYCVSRSTVYRLSKK